MSKAKPTLGLIGIGLMGQPMALNFLAAGYSLNIWNRTTSKCQPLVAAGAHLQTTIGQLTQASDIILLCLSDTDAVKAIIHRNDGIIQYGNSTQQLIDLSSIDPEITVQLADELKEETGLLAYDAKIIFNVESKSNRHTVVLIKAKGTARPKQEVNKIHYYNPGDKIRMSQGTKLILKKYFDYKFELIKKFS